MAAALKLDCFREEDEWRIISWQPKAFYDNNFKFRAGKSMIIPYFAIPINLESIIEITIGPSQHPDLAKSAVEGLVKKYNLDDTKIRLSRIPYRVF